MDVTAKPRPVLREFAALVVATKAGAIGHWGVLRNRCAPGTAGVPPAKGGLEARGPRRSGASAWQLLPSAARYGNYTEKMARDGCGHGGRKRASYKACSYNNHVRRRLSRTRLAGSARRALSQPTERRAHLQVDQLVDSANLSEDHF